MNTAALLLLGLVLSAGPDPADGHLVAGANAFREGRFDEALVEFRVAQKLGAADAGDYAAATLVKLGRPEDAVDLFGRTPAKPGDTLLSYYRALACYETRLYLCADRLLAGVAAQAGPGMSEQAARTRAAIQAVLHDEPSKETIDWYLGRCSGSDVSVRPRLAAAYCAEAEGLSSRRRDAHGASAAREGLARARQAGAAR